MFLKLIMCSIICLASSENCNKYLVRLANHQKDLIQCITVNSVPVTMCTHCLTEYKDVLYSYDLLANICSSELFDKDRINLISSTESVLTGLWSKAFCDDCMNNNNIIVFTEKNKTFYECLSSNSETAACEVCKPKYFDLNNFYINLDQHNNGEVCYDLQDSMNRTRNTWSKELKCCRRQKNMTLFTIALGITSCLSLLFYGSTYLITKRMERNHGVLSNEGAVYNSELPSSSRYNDINNPPQSMIANRASSSNVDIDNGPAAKSLKSTCKNNFNINEDLESSDDEEQVAVKDISEKQLITLE